ncbi:MAG: PhzF family phenazine biosynthesis protein, partial [Bacteroidota bacterium]
LIGGDRSSKETIDGNRDIFLKNGLTYMEQTAPSYIPVENALPEILGSLNLSETDLLEHHLPVIVNTGNSFLIVPVANTKILQAIKPDLDRIARYSEKMGLIGYYVFSPSDEASIAATARMFGPYYGIVEEAATGMAAGPLASYLYDYHLTQNTQLTIKQGEFMPTPSPSLIHVELVTENGKINRLYAGGDAFVSTEKSVTI